MNSYAPCPKCQNTTATPVRFTWWGGLIGPKMLTHVKCGKCGFGYNGKTGRDNTAGIIIYTIVLFILFGVIGFVLALSR